MFQKVGIIGLGLIGGSLAKALKERLHTPEIIAVNRSEDTLKDAYKEGVIDAYATEVTSTFSGCDVVFLCTPVDTIAFYAEQIAKFVSPTCVVSDVGSTKTEIFRAMTSYRGRFRYIGGHPMTGSEKLRYHASKAHLFENAYYVLTPAEDVPASQTEAFRQGLLAFGAIPVVVSPQLHDEVVASISHVPHIIASALCQSVQEQDTPDHLMRLLAAGGFKDITRIASSSPEMWTSICLENQAPILSSLTHLETVIHQVKEEIARGDRDQLWKYFENARTYRNSFATTTPGAFVKRYDISVDVIDKPGSIAIIAVLFSSNNINIKNMSIVNNREQECGVVRFSFENEIERQKSVALLQSMNYEVTTID